MLKVVSASHKAAPCLFPTENLQRDARGFRSLPVAWDGESPSAPIAADTFLRAWTVVLRYYVGSDMICFGQIDDTTKTSPRFALCHGDIAVNASLKALEPSFEISEEEIRQSAADWMNTNTSFNTLLWKTSQLESFSSVEELENTKSAIVLLVSDSPEPQATLLYASHLIGEPVASAIAEAVGYVASVLLDAPETTIGEIDLFGYSSWDQIQQWNLTVPDMVEDCLHEQIDRSALTCPNKTAFDCWDGSVTYAQLVDYTNRLGNFLIDQNVGPSVFVPCCFDKSLWAPIAMLGVLKAGGAFVCIDPAQPIDRLTTIIEEVDAKVVLAAPEHCKLFAGTGCTPLAIDADFIQSLPPCHDLPRRATPKDPALAIFTSGSTGKPKGIIHEHRALCSSAKEHAVRLNINSATRTFQFASFTFIINTFELFTPLIEGGCACIPSKEDRLGRTAGAMRDLKANWACLTPSFVRSVKPEDIPDVKTLVLAGEPVQQDNLNTWRSHVRLLNMYGASEASVCVTGELSGSVDRSTIGTGTGVATWIVDVTDDDRLAPIGAIGELVVEGPVLAREYINQPEKTAASFISNTSWLQRIRDGAPSRAYKTGDLARYGSDGRINLVGRKDMQVKLRGQRIELEEVEFHLRQSFPRGIELTVGLVKPIDQPDRPFLAAFVALKKSLDADFHQVDEASAQRLDEATRGWKEQAAKSLPVYMVPSTLVKLKHMPLTASGKTNRKAIGDYASQLTVAALTGAKKKEHKEPATPTGDVLRKLWAQVLDISPESISADDSFLELGGNSIDAMKLVNIARDEAIGLSVGEVFGHPTLDEMAAASWELNAQAFEDVPFSLLDKTIDTNDLVEKAAAQCKVSASAIEDLYPCTALQDGLMALSDSRDGAYIAQHTLALGKDIDVNRFKRACQQVVDAHPILRTRIVFSAETTSLQVVVRGDIDWQVGEKLDDFLQSDKERPMRSGDSLTRYGIVREGVEWTFVWTVHHAVYDAWTLELVFDRLHKAYHGEPMPKDFTFKEFMSYVVKTDANASEEYWRDYLAGATQNEFPCTVSTAKQPVSDSTFNYEMSITSTDQQSGITLASMIRAAWGILIGSHSEADDVVFGTIVSGRNAPVSNLDRLVGPGIAAVPVRVKIPDDSTLTVRDFVKRIQSEATETIAFEQAGLQNIRRVSPEASSACDFQTLLVVQPAKDAVVTPETPNLRAVSGANANFGTYALTLECSLKSNGVACAAHYDSTLVGGDYIRRILGQLEHLLQQICISTAETKLNELTFISAQDQTNIRQWNQNIAGQVNQTIHGLIGERFAERPESEAVCAWDGSFTYAELDRHSARLARRLAELGARPEAFIPCCFEKSRWAVAAMVGVLRSGSAFLNIDPSQPESRIQLMIRKLKSETIVCSPEQYDLCTRVAEGRNIVVLNEEAPDESIPEVTPVIEASPDNAAYVIFTSGSTGEPKGTIIQHGAYCSGSTTHAPAMLMDGDIRALQFASFTFDASLVEILTVLVVGGCVCMPSEEQRKRDVTEAFRATKANWAVLTPSFVNLIKPEDVPSLKVLGLAGEAMSRSHVETWGHRVRLINAYGPSECCVCSTSNVDVTLESDPRNIGRACSGACWVVMPNNHHRLVPVGSVGELVLEGWNIGRGYLDEPTKTQAAFVENPRWLFPDDDTRPPVVYKTGDLVRYNPDGTLSFLRRKDTQVKLRGQRVELGEIEYRVKQSLASKPDAVVDILSPSDAPDQPRLVAFIPVTMEDGMGTSSADQLIPPPSEQHLAAVAGLDDLLAEFLPMHMIPSAYLPVQYIPKMPSGKADRKTLIRCGSQLTHRQMAEYSGAVVDVRPPTTEMQFTLQRLWAECLKLPTAQISLNDNFLRLGGDSITAMRLASAARAQGIPLSTATVFQHPTLEAMSAIAETLAEQKLPQSFEPFSSVKSIPKDQLINEIVLPQAKVPASSIQDVIESTDFQSLAINGGLNQTRGWSNYLVFDFDGPIDLRRLQVACEKIIAHHSILRTVFVATGSDTTGSELLQVVLHSYKPEFTFHIQDEQDPSEALVREDLARLPHLGEPIVRFILIKDGAVRHRLIMRVSHAQYDGASMPLLLQDLRLAYRGEPLPKRPNFSDFVRMQLYVSQEARAQEFYTKLLAGSAMTQFISHKKMSTTNVLNTMIADMVPLVAFKSHGITAATVIKAAWALVLGEMAATTDVVYGHMVSGRNLQLDNVEAIMGPCLNIVPVRANMGVMKTILDLLQTIQQQQTDTIPYESLGFRQIIKCTDWPADTRFSSVFQYQEFGGEDASQPVSIERTLKCAPGFICPAPDACDLSILATPVGEQVRIEMIFSNHSMSSSFAESTMRKLCSKVELISRGVEAQLPTVTEVRSLRPSIPLPEPLKAANGNVNSMVKNIVNGINSRGMNGTHETNGVEEHEEPMEEVNLLASVRIN